MSLYWPEQKVAVEIVDDPLAQPFDRAAHPDVRVLQVTCDELDDWESSMQFMDKVCDALGQPRPSKTGSTRPSPATLPSTGGSLRSNPPQGSSAGTGA